MLNHEQIGLLISSFIVLYILTAVKFTFRKKSEPFFLFFAFEEINNCTPLAFIYKYYHKELIVVGVAAILIGIGLVISLKSETTTNPTIAVVVFNYDYDSDQNKTAATSIQKDFIDRLKLAETAERYEDMVYIVREIIHTPGIQLSPDERNYFSVAYKNLIAIKRSSLRVVVRAIQEQSSSPTTAHQQELISSYREKIKNEIASLAHEVLGILDSQLDSLAMNDVEAEVFYIKMKADYSRYLAEVVENEEKVEAVENAKSYYEKAFELSKQGMMPTHPVRLGLVLNYSVFFYEILNDKEQAQLVAQTAFDSAISDLDSLSEDSYKDSTLVLQLIRDNLSLWTNDRLDDSDSEVDENLIDINPLNDQEIIERAESLD